VRKTPSWPGRSWANFSRLWLYSCMNAWTNLHLLGQLDTFLAARRPAATAAGAITTGRWPRGTLSGPPGAFKRP
jgi:hypothetical protein